MWFIAQSLSVNGKITWFVYSYNVKEGKRVRDYHKDDNGARIELSSEEQAIVICSSLNCLQTENTLLGIVNFAKNLLSNDRRR